MHALLRNSFVKTMQGKAPPQDELDALIAYLDSLDYPPNPFVGPGGKLSPSARRGKVLFEREDVGCAVCHAGERFTDGDIHDVGLGSENDRYEGYNTPSLIAVYRKTRLLHDGRAKSLERVLTKYHRPDEVGGGRELNQQEIDDLINYLRTL